MTISTKARALNTWHTCNAVSSESIPAFKTAKPFATCFAPMPKLVQTPNKVAMMEKTSMKSPIHPKIPSPING